MLHGETFDHDFNLMPGLKILQFSIVLSLRKRIKVLYLTSKHKHRLLNCHFPLNVVIKSYFVTVPIHFDFWLTNS